MKKDLTLKLGATIHHEDINFCIWAPFLKKLQIEINCGNKKELFLMQKNEQNYFNFNLKQGIQEYPIEYWFHAGNHKIADPASRYQPQGVFGPSQVVNDNFNWQDQAWQNLSLYQYIIYELHVGTYTSAGNFLAIIPFINELKKLGITAIEFMPIAQFTGQRNWGYDGVFPFAIQNSYGSPQEFKQLINACHQHGIAVILDVVYNHIGPEGNIFPLLGPYFTQKYQTPWGMAINYDDEFNHHVRRFFIENALHWFIEYHIDALRLDALHAIFDQSAYPFLLELSEYIHLLSKKLKKPLYLIAESDLNDPKLLLPKKLGGFNLDAQWNDEFHHALHTLLTHENNGYYQDFGQFNQLQKAYREGFVYSGQYSLHRKQPFGRSSKKIRADQWVVFSQNHDQIGNRFLGDRISKSLNFAQLKLIATAVILSPFIPLLFMGEEYGELNDFKFFTDYHDKKLIAAMKAGRKKEFKQFKWSKDMEDPQSVNTFLQSKLNHLLKAKKTHSILFAFYENLINLRKQNPALYTLNKHHYRIIDIKESRLLVIHRYVAEQEVLMLLNFEDSISKFELSMNRYQNWEVMVNSDEKKWDGDNYAINLKTKPPSILQADIPPLSSVLLVHKEI